MDEYDFEVVDLVGDTNLWTGLILTDISQRPSPDVIRLPSRTFLLSSYAYNFFFVSTTLQLSSQS